MINSSSVVKVSIETIAYCRVLFVHSSSSSEMTMVGNIGPVLLDPSVKTVDE